MTARGVEQGDMYDPSEFDDAAAEALLSGIGHDVDTHVASAIAVLRDTYTTPAPDVGPELAVLIGDAWPIPQQLRRTRRVRRVVVIALGALATTGSLAAANALPAPVQDVMAKFGIGVPAHQRSDAKPDDDHGADVGARSAGADPQSRAHTTATTAPSVTTTTGGTTAMSLPGDQVAAVRPVAGIDDTAEPNAETIAPVTTTTVEDENENGNGNGNALGNSHANGNGNWPGNAQGNGNGWGPGNGRGDQPYDDHNQGRGNGRGRDTAEDKNPATDKANEKGKPEHAQMPNTPPTTSEPLSP